MAASTGSWLSLFPEWWPSLGLVACPTLAGLAVLSLLGALVGVGGGVEDTSIEAPADALPERRVGFQAPTPTPNYLNFRRRETAPTMPPTMPAGGYADAGTDAGGIRYERKRNGRIEAWLVDGGVTRGKRYLTSYSGSLPEAEQAARVQAALERKAVA